MRGRVDLYIGQGDRLPFMKKKLVYDKTQDPISLEAGDGVEFFMVQEGGTRIGGECNIVDLATATVEYQWEVGDTDVPGDYLGEFVVTYSDGRDFTIPNVEGDKLLVRIAPRAAPA